MGTQTRLEGSMSDAGIATGCTVNWIAAVHTGRTAVSVSVPVVIGHSCDTGRRWGCGTRATGTARKVNRWPRTTRVPWTEIAGTAAPRAETRPWIGRSPRQGRRRCSSMVGHWPFPGAIIIQWNVFLLTTTYHQTRNRKSGYRFKLPFLYWKFGTKLPSMYRQRQITGFPLLRISPIRSFFFLFS